MSVLVVADPDGRVRSVELDRKSGSIWLDMALLSMFRDAHLPPRYAGQVAGPASLVFAFTAVQSWTRAREVL